MCKCSICSREVETVDIKLANSNKIHICNTCCKDIDAKLNGNCFWTNPSLEQLEYQIKDCKRQIRYSIEDGDDKQRKTSSRYSSYQLRLYNLKIAEERLEKYKQERGIE